MFATHDQRLRVFVSSTLNEAAAERMAARTAIEQLRLTPVMFDQGARPYPPQELYRSYLAQSDVFVGIYAEQYGWIGPGASVSGLEDEYLLSGARPKLLYIRKPAPSRDQKLTEMIGRMWGEAGVSTTNYATPEELGQLIADDLAVLLTERFAGVTQTRDDGLHPVAVPAPAAAMIGRAGELQQALTLLNRPDVRLLTLTGLGGIGKTRLVTEIVAQARHRFDLVAFADLSPISDPAQVPAALAEAAGVRVEGARPALEVLADRLHDRHALLVVDNFEQVLGAAMDIGRLLSECPQLTCIVTSRTALDIRAEQELPVGPLDTATAGVELFVARAQQYRPSFQAGPDNTPTLQAIVERLEGIPLAIELAAARSRMLSPPQLLDRLDRLEDPLDLSASDQDAPHRQQTLRRTIAWSYDLLEPMERSVLDQLSVFPAGWSLTAAETVVDCAGADLLQISSALIQHSLVVPADDRSTGAPRLRMYETVRRFAAQRLTSSGQTDATMERLASYLQELGVRIARSAGHSARARDARDELDAQIDSLRAVLQWALSTDRAELMVRVSAPLSRYLWSRGLLSEQAGLAAQATRLPSAAALPQDAANLLAWGQASMGIAVGGTQASSIPVLEGVVAQARSDGDTWLLPHALFSLALNLPYEGEAARMRSLLQEASALFEEQDDDWGVCLCLIPLGEISLRDGDPPTASDLHERALAAADRIGDRHMLGQCLNQLALDSLLTGQAPAARDLLMEAAEIHRGQPGQEGLAYTLDGFAAVLVAGGRTEDAMRVLGCSDRIRAVAGLVIWPLMQPMAEGFAAALTSMLGAGAARKLRAEGAATPPLVMLDHAVQWTA